jgi:prophage regulatory protein
MTTDRLLRLPDVIARVALSRSTILRLVAVGRFPAPMRISERAIAWSAAAVEEWIAARAAQQAGATIATADGQSAQ